MTVFFPFFSESTETENFCKTHIIPSINLYITLYIIYNGSDEIMSYRRSAMFNSRGSVERKEMRFFQINTRNKTIQLLCRSLIRNNVCDTNVLCYKIEWRRTYYYYYINPSNVIIFII